MPVLARFYGITVRMYLRGSEHNPPHVHALYGDYAAAFDLRTAEIIDGDIPPRAASLVKEWMLLHQAELMRIWETQEFERIDPLE